MSNLPNFDAEIGANLIADDAQPAISFENSGSGPGLQIFGLVASSTASIDVAEIGQVQGGNLSIATMRIVSSGASQPGISFESGAFASITSTVLTTVANTDYAIRVKVGVGTDDAFRWIPLFKDAAIIGAAAV